MFSQASIADILSGDAANSLISVFCLTIRLVMPVMEDQKNLQEMLMAVMIFQELGMEAVFSAFVSKQKKNL